MTALVCLLYPMYVIRPFRAQGVDELNRALAIVQVRPWVTLLSAVAAVAAAFVWWRGAGRRTARIGAIAAAVIACLAAAGSRVNIFERMFHPVGSPAFESAEGAKLDADDAVLAVRMNGAARAYPVRAIAYHHVVNDTLGGEPIVATY